MKKLVKCLLGIDITLTAFLVILIIFVMIPLSERTQITTYSDNYNETWWHITRGSHIIEFRFNKNVTTSKKPMDCENSGSMLPTLDCNDIRRAFNTFHSKIKKIAYLEIMDKANYSRNQYISKNYKKKMWFTPVSCLKHKNMHGREIYSDDLWIISNNNVLYPCDLNGDLQDLVGCQCVEIGKDRR